MATFEGILAGEDDWIDALGGERTRNRLRNLLRQHDTPDEAAVAWLLATTPSSRGGPQADLENARSLAKRIKHEFQLYICGRQYAKEREALQTAAEGGKQAVIASVAGFVAVHMTVPAPAIAPVVAILLIHVSRVGRNAYCRSQGRRAGRTTK